MESYTGQALNNQDVRIVDTLDPLGFKDINTADASTTVTVRDAVTGSPLSAIFSDNLVSPTVQANPYNTDSEGGFTFFAKNGLYNIVIDEGLGTEFSLENISIFDQLDLPTTLELINGARAIKPGDIIETSGFTTSGDGGGAKWQFNGVTGQTPSQSPAQLGDALLNDANGNQWRRIQSDSFTALGDTFSNYFNTLDATRTEEREFYGLAAEESGGTTNPNDSTTFIAGSDFGSFYIERMAQILSISKRGGSGGVFGAQSSARYTTLGYDVWLGLTAYLVGAKSGAGGRLYTCTVAGTSGTTPPSHTSGTATDGTVTWQFDDFTYNVAIGEAAVALADADDGSGTWARYTEVVKTAAGGTCFGEEVAVKNKGTDAINNPYEVLPAKSTVGKLFAGGGDASQGAPTAPSTCGILFIKNGETWNKGLVFGKDSITGTDGVTGFGEAISMAKGHIVNWYTAEGFQGSEIVGDVSLNAERQTLTFRNNETEIKSGGSVVFKAQRLNNTSTGAIVAQSFGDNAKILVESALTDADLILEPKGTGHVKFGVLTANADTAITGYVELKLANNSIVKLAVIA